MLNLVTAEPSLIVDTKIAIVPWSTETAADSRRLRTAWADEFSVAVSNSCRTSFEGAEAYRSQELASCCLVRMTFKEGKAVDAWASWFDEGGVELRSNEVRMGSANLGMQSPALVTVIARLVDRPGSRTVTQLETDSPRARDGATLRLIDEIIERAERVAEANEALLARQVELEAELDRVLAVLEDRGRATAIRDSTIRVLRGQNAVLNEKLRAAQISADSGNDHVAVHDAKELEAVTQSSFSMVELLGVRLGVAGLALTAASAGFGIGVVAGQLLSDDEPSVVAIQDSELDEPEIHEIVKRILSERVSISEEPAPGD